MKIIRVSQLTGVRHEREISVTEEQLYAWQNGMLIQHAMPDLSTEDREFIITGITPEEWADAFPEPESLIFD